MPFLRSLEYFRGGVDYSSQREDWKWSSAKFWIQNKPDPVGVDIPEYWRDTN
ncbi:MAG: hypothetical protein P9L92_02595 [Candidatus Electryonea clarkiae]|nr:hypothetical protein [Candidatus Electryonea clarkiae]MDP8288718.1 hypothetical protein [Candidatus Electryonea clarkiae]